MVGSSPREALRAASERVAQSAKAEWTGDDVRGFSKVASNQVMIYGKVSDSVNQ